MRYSVSNRRDTTFEASFRHRIKYLADALSLEPHNSMCIPFEISFKFLLEQKNWIFEIDEVLRLHDTLYNSVMKMIISAN